MKFFSEDIIGEVWVGVKVKVYSVATLDVIELFHIKLGEVVQALFFFIFKNIGNLRMIHK